MDENIILLAPQSGVSAEIPVLESAPSAAIPEETTTAVVSVNALSRPLNDFTVTEFLLLLIFVLLAFCIVAGILQLLRWVTMSITKGGRNL